jgi:hypothetical protein
MVAKTEAKLTIWENVGFPIDTKMKAWYSHIKVIFVQKD